MIVQKIRPTFWLRAGGMLLLGAMVLAPDIAQPAQAQPVKAPEQNWSFKGPLGHFDLPSVQRGYAVFAGICASCHSLSEVRFSDLTDMGLTLEEVGAVAATWQVADGLDAEGRLKHRNARPDDALSSSYSGPEAARAANGGVVPPDLSRIVQVYPGGADRLFALLTGYKPDAARVPGKGFANSFAIGHYTAMPPPLREGAVKYADNTPATVTQEARDVTTFLAWVSAPHQDTRRRVGIGAGLYLCFLAVLFVILNRRLWSHVRK